MKMKDCKCVLNKAQRNAHFLNGKCLAFKWSVSRGRETYGYNICSLYIGGQKIASCKGGGYDMEGECLGQFISRFFVEELKKLSPAEFNGLAFIGKNKKHLKAYRRGCDTLILGATGFFSMRRILNRIGFELDYSQSIGQSLIYTIRAV